MTRNFFVRFSALAIAALMLAFGAVGTASAAERTLYEGGFTNVEKRTSGSWRIFEKDGARFIALSEDFRTRGAPDLKLFLHPEEASSVNGSNATQGSVLVSPLASKKGAQVYEIPAGVALEDYASIVIHCEQFSVFWAAGDL
jgi:hypothetical protein